MNALGPDSRVPFLARKRKVGACALISMGAADIEIGLKQSN